MDLGKSKAISKAGRMRGNVREQLGEVMKSWEEDFRS